MQIVVFIFGAWHHRLLIRYPWTTAGDSGVSLVSGHHVGHWIYLRVRLLYWPNACLFRMVDFNKIRKLKTGISQLAVEAKAHSWDTQCMIHGQHLQFHLWEVQEDIFILFWKDGGYFTYQNMHHLYCLQIAVQESHSHLQCLYTLANADDKWMQSRVELAL